jgi:hypothetical protein
MPQLLMPKAIISTTQIHNTLFFFIYVCLLFQSLIAESEVLLGRDAEIEIFVTIKDELGGFENARELF